MKIRRKSDERDQSAFAQTIVPELMTIVGALAIMVTQNLGGPDRTQQGTSVSRKPSQDHSPPPGQDRITI
jgi:hypothetical protein